MHPRRYSPFSSRLHLSQRLPGSSSAALPSGCLSPPAKAESAKWRRCRIPDCQRSRPPQRRRTRPKRSSDVAVAPKRAPFLERPRHCNCGGGVGAAASLKNERSTKGTLKGAPPTTNAPIGGEPWAEAVAPAAAAAAVSLFLSCERGREPPPPP